MDLEVKNVINISTNLSNTENIKVYDEHGQTYRNQLLCKYLYSNNDQLINHSFIQFVDSIYLNNSYKSIAHLFDYNSDNPFYVRYNISQKIKYINDLMFNGCNTLTSVMNIDQSFIKIGKYAFNGCINLIQLNLPSSIKEIDSFALYGTNKLKNIDVKNVTKLHNYSFAGAGIESIKLNDNINTLYHYLFKDCKNLKKFENDIIYSIGEGVFAGCTSLEYVQFKTLRQIFEDEEEYIETPETIKEKFLPKVYEFELFVNDNGEYISTKNHFRVITLENTIDDEDNSLYGFLKFYSDEDVHEEDPLIISYDWFTHLIYYVTNDIINDTEGNLFNFYDEDGHLIENFKIKVYVGEGEEPGPDEPEPLEITIFNLYDNRYNFIGHLTKELSQRLLEYNDSLEDPIVTYEEDTTTGECTIIYNDVVTFIEYFQDGTTPTGNTFDNARILTENDQVQNISLYKIYNDEELIEDTNDINTCIIFNEDFSEIRFKLKCYPIYDPTETYICYYMFEPFLQLRLKYEQIAEDIKLVPIVSKNNQAYKDNGLICVDGNKYPVYNKNYCYLGLNTNDQVLFYTNQEELDTYASRIEPIYVYDDNGNMVMQYFMLPSSYNYSEHNINTESEFMNTYRAVETILKELMQILGIHKNAYEFFDNDEDDDYIEDIPRKILHNHPCSCQYWVRYNPDDPEEHLTMDYVVAFDGTYAVDPARKGNQKVIVENTEPRMDDWKFGMIVQRSYIGTYNVDHEYNHADEVLPRYLCYDPQMQADGYYKSYYILHTANNGGIPNTWVADGPGKAFLLDPTKNIKIPRKFFRNDDQYQTYLDKENLTLVDIPNPDVPELEPELDFESLNPEVLGTYNVVVVPRTKTDNYKVRLNDQNEVLYHYGPYDRIENPIDNVNSPFYGKAILRIFIPNIEASEDNSSNVMRPYYMFFDPQFFNNGYDVAYHYMDKWGYTNESLKFMLYENDERIPEEYFENKENQEEEEETTVTYNNFDINDLTYYLDKIKMPKYLFTSCIKLSNDNIIMTGNYNSLESNTTITFSNILDGDYYTGTWIDNIKFNFYTPSDVTYTYNFKWKIMKDKNYQYFIKIILNDKTYYIKETYVSATNVYNRTLIDFNNTFNDSIVLGIVNNSISIKDINLFNQTFANIKLTNYHKSIYDKYPLLDLFNVVSECSLMNCKSFIRINNKFDEIENYGFKDCINLKEINLAKTKLIGHYAFENCESLGEINLMSILSTNSEGTFQNCYNLTTINNLRLKKINDYMFKNCKKLNNVSFNIITEIGNESFFGCESLELDDIGLTNVTKFGDYAFAYCNNLCHITQNNTLKFNDELKSLGNGVFKGCKDIVHVELPTTINNLTYELFNYCSNLESIEFKVPATNGDFNLTGLDFCNKMKTIIIPDNENNNAKYVTPNNDCIISRKFNTNNNLTESTIIYVCKDIDIFTINKENFGNTVTITDNAFNNSNVLIINIDNSITFKNLNINTFKNIKNKKYYLLIENKDINESQYKKLLEIVGKKHIYFK